MHCWDTSKFFHLLLHVVDARHVCKATTSKKEKREDLDTSNYGRDMGPLEERADLPAANRSEGLCMPLASRREGLCMCMCST